jgi:hypothetical protein
LRGERSAAAERWGDGGDLRRVRYEDSRVGAPALVKQVSLKDAKFAKIKIAEIKIAKIRLRR